MAKQTKSVADEDGFDPVRDAVCNLARDIFVRLITTPGSASKTAEGWAEKAFTEATAFYAVAREKAES
jgi:hypothetical protein